jgi:hypothetical protein
MLSIAARIASGGGCGQCGAEALVVLVVDAAAGAIDGAGAAADAAADDADPPDDEPAF